MKIFSLLLIFLFFGNVYSQTIEVEFDSYFNFNSGTVKSYDSIIDPKNHIFKQDEIGLNRYVFNMDTKTVSLYFNNRLVYSVKMTSHSQKNGFYYFKMEDEEALTGKIVESKVIICTNPTSTKHPYFVSYFISTLDGTTNGSIAMKKSD